MFVHVHVNNSVCVCMCVCLKKRLSCVFCIEDDE